MAIWATLSRSALAAASSSVVAGREVDTSLRNGLVVAKIGDALIHHLDRIGVQHAKSSGGDRSLAGDIGGALRHISGYLRV